MVSRKRSLLSMAEDMSTRTKARLKMMARGSTKQITIKPIETYKEIDTGQGLADGAALKKQPG